MIKSSVAILLSLALILCTVILPINRVEAAQPRYIDSECVQISQKDLDSIVALIEGSYSQVSYGPMQYENMSESVKDGIINRSTALLAMENRMGCIFDDVTFVPCINSANYINNNIVASVYLTTGISYHYQDVECSNDYAAFGVYHTMEFEPKEDSWKIVYDSFDERSITGIASSDRMHLSGEEQETCRSNEKTELIIPQQDRGPFTDYDINGTLLYAMTYCGFAPTVRKYHSVTGINPNNPSQATIPHGTQNYNQNFNHDYTSTKDCANYVSQCLWAGDFPTNSIWYFSGSNANWVGADELITYLSSTMNYGSKVQVNAAYTNVYAGNPIFWSTDGGDHAFHVAICVGENTGGIPVVNAHTADLYRVPISALSTIKTSGGVDSNYMGTVLLTSSNLHPTHTSSYNNWYYDATYHYRICQYCEYPSFCAVHTPNIYGDCSVCGALGPF